MPFDIVGARQAGYSDAEIADELAKSSKFNAGAARQAGYNDQEILGHLLGETGVGTQETGVWASVKDVAQEIPKGVVRGLDNLGSMGGGAIKWAGDVTGIEAVSDAGESVRELYSERAQREGTKADVATYKDVDGTEDVAKYLLGGLGEAVPMFIPGMGGAMVGAKLATKGAIAGLERAAAGEAVDMLAPAAIKAVSSAAVKGTVAGAFAGSYGMELGSIYADQAEQGIEKPGKAAAYAVPAAALDVVGELIIMAKIPAFKALQDLPFLKTAEGKSWFTRGAKEAFKGGGTEAVTEFAQTLIERGGADKSMMDKAAFEEALNGAIIGGFTGGVFSGAGGAMSRPATPVAPVTDAPHDIITGEAATSAAPGSVAGVLSALQNPTESAIPVNAEPTPQGNILDEMLNGPATVKESLIVQPAPPSDVPSAQTVTEPSQSAAPANILTPAAVEQEISHLTAVAESQKAEALKLQTQVANGEVDPKQAQPLVALAKARVKAAEDAVKVHADNQQATIDAAAPVAAIETPAEPVAAPQAPEVVEVADDIRSLVDGKSPADVRKTINMVRGLNPERADQIESYFTSTQAPAVPTVLDAAAHEAAASPNNDLPLPTPAQAEAGNYKMGHVSIHGLDVSVENPHGSTRSGVSPTGEKWETTMSDHYGYIKGTVGKDKDHIDVFIKTGTEEDAGTHVYVVDQIDPATGKMDEHKVIMGADSVEDARAVYLRNYDQSGKQRIGAITPSTVEEFKGWLQNGNTKKPFGKIGTEGSQDGASVPAPFVEHRSDVVKRQRVADMTPEEMRNELFTDKLTGLKNERAFDEADKDGKLISSIDVSGLKHLNDTYGHGAGDALLKAVADAFKAHGIEDVYRLHGDEYATIGIAAGKLDEVKAALAKKELIATLATGEEVSTVGWGFDYGTGTDYKTADIALNTGRRAAEAAGTRTTDRGKPGGVVETKRLPDGNDVQGGIKPELTSDEQADSEMAAALERRKVRKAAEVAASAPAAPAAKSPTSKGLDKSVKAWTLKAEVKGDVIHVTAKLNVRPHELYPDTPDHSFDIPVSEWKATDSAGNFYKAQTDLIKKYSPLDDMEAVNGRIRDGQHKAIDTALSPAGLMTAKEQQAANRERLKPQSKREPIPNSTHRTAAEAASSAAGHAKSAFDAGVDAINDIFKNATDPNKLGSGPVVDDKIWAQVKPHLDKMWAESKAAFKDASEALDAFVDKCIDTLGDKIVPYMTKFYREVKSSDKVKDTTDTKEATNEADEPAVQPDGNGDSKVSGEGDVAVHTPGKDEQKSGEVAGSDSGRSEGSESRQLDVTADYVHADFEKLGHGSQKVKAANNIKAITIIKDMIETGRLATPEERDTLANYVGWGAVSQLFDADRKEWSKEHTELKDLLTPAEFSEARSSTQNAFYTPPVVVNATYEALARFGVTGGTFKDSAIGVGNWLGMMPEALKKRAQWFGAEKDTITATIAKSLYPSATIINAPYEDVNYADNHFDVSVGNPPFGSVKITDVKEKDLSGLSLHNYFFAKDIKKLRPGGILAQVVSSSLMDKQGELDRMRFANDVRLLGAIRLPNTSFKANAGTEVTTDIIFLQKLKPGEVGTTEWTKTQLVTGADGNAYKVNEYFAKHPEMVLGDYTANGQHGEYIDGVYSGVAGVAPKAGVNLDAALKEAIAKLPENVYHAEDRTRDMLDPSKAVTPPGETKVWGYFVKDGVVHQRTPDINGGRDSLPAMVGVKTPRQMNEKEVAQVTGMLGVLDAYRRLQRAELSDETTGKIELLRKALNHSYDSFVKEHGYISQSSNERVMRGDINDFPNLLALEKDFDKGVSAGIAKKEGTASRKPAAQKSDIFTKRQLVPYTRAEKADTAYDALMIALSETGRIDLGRMEELTDKPYADLLAELGEIVFKDPDAGTVLADEYLSGNVKKKLARAKEMLTHDPKWQANVDALEKVQPVDLTPDRINVRLGSHWVPQEVYADFISHILEGKAVTAFIPEIGRTVISYPEGKDRLSAVARRSTYGTESADATWLLERIFDNRDITIRTEKDEEGASQVDADATLAANQKANDIKNAFDEWLWTDPERRILVAGTYNEKMNTDVERKWDGFHLITPGKSESITLHKQQKDVAWRAIQDGRVVMDHAVGAGKTFAIITAVMEMRRMGLSKKPMIVVPNHLVGQWAGDFKRLYPAANILMINRKDFTAKNRKAFIARIATGDYDAVVIAHSSFGFIPAPAEYEKTFYGEQLADLEIAIREARAEANDNSKPGKSRNPTVKELEAAKDRFLNKLKKLQDKSEDDVADFDELGVDSLFLDESHEYRTLYYTTRRSRIKGLGNTSGNKKTTDLFVKAQYLMDRNKGRGLFFATGTPISNTMAEVYTIQKYMDYRNLKAMGLHHFDTWANTFGTEVTDWELNAGMQLKATNRFKRFVNAPELAAMYRKFADVVTLKQLKAQAIERGEVWPVPNVKGGKPNNIVAERSAEQADFMNWIVNRMENIDPKRPDLDNHLWCETHARMAGLDLRILVPDALDHPDSKVNRAVSDIYDIFKKWDARKGTQLVFCDLSTPKKHKGAAAAKQAERDAKAKAAEDTDTAVMEQDSGDDEAGDTELISADDLLADQLGGSHDFSVYDDMKVKLIAKGVKESQIAFIHDYNTDAQKMDLYAKMNAGDVRVLFGSTSKMGAGMNVQERLVALHHMDAPYMPKDLEQREGRIIRQGNRFYMEDPSGFYVEINRYGTKEMYDARMWEIVESKAGYTEQFRNGGMTTREIEDVVPESENAASMKAAISGNPLIREEMDLNQKVKELTALEKNDKTARWDLEARVISGNRADANHKIDMEAFNKMAQRKVDNPHTVASNHPEWRISLSTASGENTPFQAPAPKSVPAVPERAELKAVPEDATKEQKKEINDSNNAIVEAHKVYVNAAKEVEQANETALDDNRKAAADTALKGFTRYVNGMGTATTGKSHFGAYRGFAVYIKHDTKGHMLKLPSGAYRQTYVPEISFSLHDPSNDTGALVSSAPYERDENGQFAFSPTGFFTRLDNMVEFTANPAKKAELDDRRDRMKKNAQAAQEQLDKPSPHAAALAEAREAHDAKLAEINATGGDVNAKLEVMQQERWDDMLQQQRMKKAIRDSRKAENKTVAAGQQTIHSNPFLDPAAIVKSLSGLKENLQADIPKLVELGKEVYKKTGDKINLFLAGMKNHLGELYDRFKEQMINVYRDVKRIVADERGKVGKDINEEDDTVRVGADSPLATLKQGFIDKLTRMVDAALTDSTEKNDRVAQGISKAHEWATYATNKMSPLGQLQNKSGFLASRYKALGNLDEINSTVEGIYQTLSKAHDTGDMPALYDFFTTKDADVNTITDPEVSAMASAVKQQIVAIGDILVEKGWLKLEKHENTAGSYLPRAYLKHILGAETFASWAGGKKLNKGYLKRRKDIPEEVRRIVLGEVTDAAYLAARAVSLPLRDIAVSEWLETVAADATSGWVLDGSLAEWSFPAGSKPKKVTPFWLKSEAIRLREQARHMEDLDADDARALADKMDDTANATLEEAGLDPLHLDEVPKGYKKLPDSPRYGALRGMVVQREIYNDIVGMGDISLGESDMKRAIVGTTTKAISLWKFMKVAANPPAQVRNFVTNMVLLHLSGVPFVRVPQRMLQAIAEIKNNGPHWQIAKRMGVRGATFANVEMGRANDELKTRVRKNVGDASWMYATRKVLSIAKEWGYYKPGELYQFFEAIGKTAKIIDMMEREGADAEAAGLAAHEALFDYSLVPPGIRWLRLSPMGAPFITFMYKAFPQLLKIAATKPWRFAPYATLMVVMQSIVSSMSGVDDDDLDKLKKHLPEWLQEKGHTMFLPFKDDQGRWQVLDLSYFFPWTPFTEMAGELAKGELAKAVGTLSLFGGPVLSLIQAAATSKDPFTRKLIVPEASPTGGETAAGWMAYLYRLSAPTWLTDMGFAGKLYDAYTGKPDKFGDPKITKGQAWLRGVGVNVVSIDVERSRASNLERIEAEVSALRSQFKKTMQANPNMSAPDRISALRKHQEKVVDIQKKAADYVQSMQ